MKIFVLGATGKLGSEFVKQALDKGDEVTAFVRNAQKMSKESPNLKVLEGNIFDKEAVSSALKGHDAVVSCLGFEKNPQPVTGYLESAKTVVAGMREQEIKRLVYVTSWFTDVEVANSRAKFIMRWVVIPMLKPILMGMREMELYLEKECKDIDYTVVRPPRLGTGDKTDQPLYAYEDFLVDTGKDSATVKRSDVASFLVSCLMENKYVQKMVAITHTEQK